MKRVLAPGQILIKVSAAGLIARMYCSDKVAIRHRRVSLRFWDLSNRLSFLAWERVLQNSNSEMKFVRWSVVVLDMMPVMLKRLALTGSTHRARDRIFKRKLRDEVLCYCWPVIERGDYQVVID